jgi:hypothetical protein
LLAGTFFLLFWVPRLVPSSLGMYRELATTALRLLFGSALVGLVLVRVGGHEPRHLGLAPNGHTAMRLAVGVFAGVALSLAAFLVAWVAGALSVRPSDAEDLPTGTGLLVNAAALMCAAAFEEMMFRVGLTGSLLGRVPPAIALGAPAAVFGLLHGLNPGATPLGVTNTMLAGLLLGLMYVERGARQLPSLGLAVGFHFAWNFCLGHVYGGPVSGHLRGRAFLHSEASDVLWSGGGYGLEGGMGTTIVLLIGCAGTLFYAAPAVWRTAR